MTGETNNITYRIDRCCYAYPSGAKLQDLTLSLQGGTFYGLIGPNGSGKTTFIDLLAALKSPDSGSVLLYDSPIHRYSKKNLAQHIALVPQTFHLEFDYTVFDVVMMGRHPHIPRFANPTGADISAVEESLHVLDISHLRDRFVTQLSGGERQRVVVARALAQETKVLVLDEATASLDIKHSIDIMTALKHRVSAKGVTVIAAIHDLDLAAAFCDELIALHDGKLYAYGAIEQVLSPDFLARVFSVSAEIAQEPNKPPHIRYRYCNGF